MPIELPEDMPTLSLADAESVGIRPNGFRCAVIRGLILEANIVTSSVQMRNLIDQGDLELIRGENSDAALHDVFSYSPRKVINHHNYMDALFPGDVIRVGSSFVRLVD